MRADICHECYWTCTGTGENPHRFTFAAFHLLSADLAAFSFFSRRITSLFVPLLRATFRYILSILALLKIASYRVTGIVCGQKVTNGATRALA